MTLSEFITLALSLLVLSTIETQNAGKQSLTSQGYTDVTSNSTLFSIGCAEWKATSPTGQKVEVTTCPATTVYTNDKN